MSADKGLLRALDQEISRTESLAVANIVNQRQSLKELKPSRVKLKKKSIRLGLETYRHLALEASLEDMRSLHKLRICGKKLKYLTEAGILVFDNKKDYILLIAMHNTIGLLNDVSENRRLLKELSQKPDFIGLSDQLPAIEAAFTAQELASKKEVQRLLFKTKLRWLHLQKP